MDSLYRFVGQFWIDIGAVLSSVLVLFGGIYLACTASPIWLNRAGALIIVFGLVVTALRFHEWFDQMVKDSYASVLDEVIDESARKERLSISNEDRERLHSFSKAKVNGMLADVVDKNNRRMQMYEIYLVILGTLLNGFGDYLVCSITICP